MHEYKTCKRCKHRIFFLHACRQEKDFTFVHASTYNYQENAEGILRAFSALAKENPTAKLIMIGDAPDAIKKLAASLNISSQILFTGLVSYTDVGGIPEMIDDTNGMLIQSEDENVFCIQ